MQLQAQAEAALAALRAAGFEHAQATASQAVQMELNAIDNEPSLLRSVEAGTLSLAGIVDGRMARTRVTSPDAAGLQQCARQLFQDAMGAPQDAAHALSSGQRARVTQGPQEADPSQLTGALSTLLKFRAEATPTMHLESAIASHERRDFHLLTTGGSDVAGQVGFYTVMAMGSAREGQRSSSFNYTAGHTHDLGGVLDQFGLTAMLRDTTRQVDANPLGEKFVGDVVLAPNAVQDLVGWLLGQLTDASLVAGTSLYRDSAGQPIASPHFNLDLTGDMPGVVGVSSDGFVAPSRAVVRDGVLQALLPTLYGSRKTGVAHVPTPAEGGWDVRAGTTALADLVGGVQRGALVGRLSMGRPAANGDFSGVIKNSFRLQGGEVGGALSETMISGNVATMLRDIIGASRERQAGTGMQLPWLRVANLHFS
ncbi:metallopeptidase TldD-related protein [Ramlibacter algicola]|uniref:Metalloprotease TldD/E C-terminal domain-containing protein n=1 Tax=Ramlibacter algicola TaxID=2795217 RepID=A0A934Q136_9BURK|nr:metallopeptidase TldD-related protein [Ramlibacter algicola]MBK0392322.1 hypothetical protein [Ramlibacter algicola]